MEKEQIIAWLKDVCQGKDWYHDISFDQYGRVVVYVKYMNGEVLRAVPDWTEDGKQVLCHFAASDPNVKSDLVNKPQEYIPFGKHGEINILTASDVRLFVDVGGMPPEVPVPGRGRQRLGDYIFPPKRREQDLELSVRALTDELDRLERLCGSNILQDIFYETHDQNNAVTNLSAKYPEVRQRIQKLYDKYGFDVIYEELDG
jgi:hypothetical protein